LRSSEAGLVAATLTLRVRRWPVSADTATVFFTYCPEDRPFAMRLAEDLEGGGVMVGLSQLDTEPGLGAVMLVVLSRVSVTSRDVHNQITLALKKEIESFPFSIATATCPSASRA
jgi:hypothetical protein